MVATYLAKGMREACYSASGYSVPLAMEWMDANVGDRSMPTADGGDLKEELLREKIRSERAAADAQEMKNQIAQSLLVQREDVLQEVAELILRIKTRLEAVPNEMEMDFPSEQRPQLKGVVANRIELILREMAGWQLEGTTDEQDTDLSDS